MLLSCVPFRAGVWPRVRPRPLQHCGGMHPLALAFTGVRAFPHWMSSSVAHDLQEVPSWALIGNDYVDSSSF